jgi:hypothetical protein
MSLAKRPRTTWRSASRRANTAPTPCKTMHAAKKSNTPLSCLLNMFLLSPPWLDLVAVSSELNALLSGASSELQVWFMGRSFNSSGHLNTNRLSFSTF